MRLESPGRPHLTYCTNVHPGESWPEVRANLERFLPAVKAQVAPERPFGVGLRLSAAAAEALARPGELEAARELLEAHGLYVFTVNGFPYGPFHGRPVKEAVYLPDWTDEARLRYTDRLAGLLASLLPDEPGLEGTVSTVPGAFRPRVTADADIAAMADNLIRHLATLHRIAETTGRQVVLALEPEPCCYLETVADTVSFFERRLFAAAAVRRLGRLTGLVRGEGEAFLRRHLGVCFDACHMAVEFEDAGAALGAFDRAGIRIAKVQLSAGLQATLRPGDGAALAALESFADPVYLHQVVERRGGALVRYLDLPQALESLRHAPAAEREWRIHFHVPLFQEHLGPFLSTQAYLRELLALLRREPRCPHLEVETYTWGVLPEAHRPADIVLGVADELRWVLDRMRP